MLIQRGTTDRKRRALSRAALTLSCFVVAPLGQIVPATAQPSQAAQSPAIHIVKAGETLYGIARRYAQDPMAIARANHLDAPFILTPGERLLLSTTVGSTPSPAVSAQAVTLPALPVVTPAVPKHAPAFPTVTTGTPPPVTAPQPPSALTKTYSIILGLRDGARYIGDVKATIRPDGSVTVNVRQTLDLLATVLDKPSFAALAAALGSKEEAPLSDFAAGGVSAHYDSGQLQVVIDVSPRSRPSQSLEVAALDTALIGDVAIPEIFSGYMNLRASADYVEKGGNTGIQQPLLLLDGALNYRGLVLEGDAQYQPNATGAAFTRQDTRLVYDDETHLIRWSAGDLSVQTDGFQGSRDMVGLSMLRLYNELAPQQNVRPRGNRTFTLERSSTVQTYVNGQPVQQVRLGPGTYDASNFPFVEGANDVHLVITDDAGVAQNIGFSIFFDRNLLKTGLTEFGLFAGASSQLSGSNVTYDDAKPLITGFWRHGFSDVLTAGANVQADRTVQMAGITGLWGSPLGTIGFDFAGSKHRFAGNGYALNIGFQRLFQQVGSFESQTISASFEMRSKNFAGIAPEDDTLTALSTAGLPNNPYTYEAALSYGRSFGEYSYVELDGRYAKARNRGDDVGSVRASIGYELPQNANLNVSLQYATGGFQTGLSAGIQLTYRLSETSSVRADYQTQNNLARLSYQNSGGRGADAWSYSGDLEHIPGTVNFDGSADYSTNRAELGAAQTVAYDSHGSGVTDVRTTLRAGTSIAFAGNSFAIGRPIFDSFAIFKPHPTLGDAPVVVEPNPLGDLARSGSLGPALLNDMGSHSLRTVTYDVPTAPPGYDIGSGALRALPSYKSGYRVIVGSDYSIVVIGRLLDRDGQPIPLLAGQAVELAPNGRTITLFTSRDGRFGAQGLRPGRWRIEMPSAPPVTYEIDVQGPKSLIMVGDLKPSDPGEKK